MITKAAPAEPMRALNDFTSGTENRLRLPIQKVLYGVGVLLSTFVVGWGTWTYARSGPLVIPTASPTRVRHVIASPLSLWATRQANNLTVTWDSQRPAIAGARIGILTIDDQGIKNEFPLTKTQLQSSKLLYVSRSSSLQEITLEVFSAEGTSMRESILLAAAQPSAQTQLPSNEVVVRQRTVSPKIAAESPKATAERVRRLFTVPPPRPSQTVTAPPDLTESVRAAHMVSASPPKLQTPEYLASSILQSPRPETLPAGGRRLDEHPASMKVQPPVPISQVKPILTPTIVALLKRRVTVQVKVFINTDGKVVNVQASAPPSPVNQHLEEAASNAARMWRFEPARRGDTKLPSEFILNFAFGSNP